MSKEQIENSQNIYNQHVFCCTNQRPDQHPRGCCLNKNSEKLRNYMKARAKEIGLSDVRINNSGCLDQCEKGPVMVIYPAGVWYHYQTIEDVEEILDTHLKQGKVVTRLLLDKN
ncbi:MAG: (2Fe-2S) ferredoxin domain-containing protein [Alphaproteobacteria bacterium]|nr:(2Fe-2S) ferredoxin domain-containing protein [Alphaproteobacteria bacterium]